MSRAVAEAPDSAVIIRGHHLLRDAHGAEDLRRTAAPAAAWARLLRGEVAPDGPHGFGAPEATLVRADALARLGAALPRDTPALADLLLRMESDGAPMHDCDAVLGIRAAPADPVATRAAWTALVGQRAGASAGQRLEEAWDQAIAEADARAAAARPAQRALAVIAALDRVSPALGRAVERLLLGGMVRRLRGMVRR